MNKYQMGWLRLLKKVITLARLRVAEVDEDCVTHDNRLDDVLMLLDTVIDELENMMDKLAYETDVMYSHLADKRDDND